METGSEWLHAIKFRDDMMTLFTEELGKMRTEYTSKLVDLGQRERALLDQERIRDVNDSKCTCSRGNAAAHDALHDSTVQDLKSRNDEFRNEIDRLNNRNTELENRLRQQILLVKKVIGD